MFSYLFPACVLFDWRLNQSCQTPGAQSELLSNLEVAIMWNIWVGHVKIRWTRVDWELFEKRAVLLMFFFSPPERFNTRESVRLFIARVALYRIWVPWWVQEQRFVEFIDVELLRDQTLFSSHSKLLHRIWYHQLKITLYQSEDLTRKNSPCMCNVWTNIPSLCKL